MWNKSTTSCQSAVHYLLLDYVTQCIIMSRHCRRRMSIKLASAVILLYNKSITICTTNSLLLIVQQIEVMEFAPKYAAQEHQYLPSLFSRSYCWTQCDQLLPWYCRLSVRPSVCLFVTKVIVALRADVFVESCTVVFLGGHSGTSYSLLQTHFL